MRTRNQTTVPDAMRSDRHGRTAHVDNDRRRRPFDGFRVRDAGRFDRVVSDAVSALPQRLAVPLERAKVVVTDIPPADRTTPEGDVLLAEFAGRVLIVYRRPLELRADSRADLADAVRVAVGEAVAQALGIDDDLDDLYGDDQD